MVLANYIVLEPGIPKAMHFTRAEFLKRVIVDPDTTAEKTITVLEFQVDREDGIAVDKTFSVSSEKLARQLAPLVPGDAFRDKLITITKSGTGYRTEYSVKVQPLVPPA